MGCLFQLTDFGTDTPFIYIKPEVDILIDTTQPDIIIGTETWLDSKTSSYEYFSKDQYTVFRKDRPPNKKGQCHGGVLIAISNNFLCTEIKELDTVCEMIWVELLISNAHKCYICAYYRPQPDDDTSLDLLNESISRINASSKSAIIIGVDFNLGNINWETSSVIPGKTNQKLQQFLDIINDHSLAQVYLYINISRPRIAQQQQITSFVSTANVGKLSASQENDDSVFSDSTLAKPKSAKRPHTCLSSDGDHSLCIETELNEIRKSKKDILKKEDVNMIVTETVTSLHAQMKKRDEKGT
ncbi:unnamed protein product [Mytilus coruscus]|uniref:Endonuclease/exonuclease/phosphatase domain-containing protein n=1 Tax=Mytilus coruscus TaxID=42192 RepID=A0A6J8EDP4_MYTCO|nr:unnamed protein product [Mytilus coruscus]